MITRYKIHFNQLQKDFFVKIEKPEGTNISIFLAHYIFYQELTPKNQSLFSSQLRHVGGSVRLHTIEKEKYDKIKVLSIEEINPQEEKIFATK